MRDRGFDFNNYSTCSIDGENIVTAMISAFVGLVVWISDNIVENTITDACFGIIYHFAEIAAQYDQKCGILIGMIPAFIMACSTFAGLKTVLKLFRRGVGCPRVLEG